jgi:hypothetical protein
MKAELRGPLRWVVSRRQVFRTSIDYPAGYVIETLECGHERREPLDPTLDDILDELDPSRKVPTRRRCVECGPGGKEEP